MVRSGKQQESAEYILPARRLEGTQTEVLAQLDELILGLTGLRQLVSLHGPKPADVPKRKLRLVRNFVKTVLLLGAFLGVQPATAQTLDAPVAPQTAAPSQEPADPNPGALTLSGGIDFLNQYML